MAPGTRSSCCLPFRLDPHRTHTGHPPDGRAAESCRPPRQGWLWARCPVTRLGVTQPLARYALSRFNTAFNAFSMQILSSCFIKHSCITSPFTFHPFTVGLFGVFLSLYLFHEIAAFSYVMCKRKTYLPARFSPKRLCAGNYNWKIEIIGRNDLSFPNEGFGLPRAAGGGQSRGAAREHPCGGARLPALRCLVWSWEVHREGMRVTREGFPPL